MKLPFASFILFISIFDLTDATAYQFLRLEKCDSNNESITAVEVCVLGTDSFNLTINAKRPIRKFFVCSVVRFN